MTHYAADADNVTPLPGGLPPCAACGGNGAEVWPCPFCGQRLHVECGHGVEYRPALGPPRRIGGKPIIGAWHCTECTTVTGFEIADPGGARS